jgi:hypothetical protein
MLVFEVLINGLFGDRKGFGDIIHSDALDTKAPK